MPAHDIDALERELRAVSERSLELLKIIHMPGYTTPSEFTLVFAAVQAIAAQLGALVNVSKQIVAHADSR